MPRASPPSLMVAFGGLRMVLFPIPIITIFWKDQIGMSLGDIMLLQAIFALSAVVIEFPSGYVADRMGHRASLFVSAMLWLAGWTAYAAAGTFSGMIVAEVALGAGMAFASGADSALLYTALQDQDRAGEYRRWEGRVRAGGQGSEALSSVVGGYLYTIHPRLPFGLQIPVALAALLLVGLMRQPRRPEAAKRASHFGEAWWIVRHTLIHHPRLRASVCLSVVLSLATFVMVWLIQPYMQAHGVPEAWFGPIWAVAHLYLAGASLASSRAADRFGAQSVLAACCVLILVGYGGLALGASGAAVAFYLCFMTVRGLQGPILAHALQHDAPEGTRASVLSLNALLFRLSFIVVGPPLGILVDRVGMETALVGLGVGFTAVALLTLALFRRAHAPSAS